MEPGVRIAAAASVLLGGLLVALLFRRDAVTESPQPAASERLLLPKQASTPESVPPALNAAQYPSTGFPVASPIGPNTTVLMPADVGQTPPEIEREHPNASNSASSGWGARVELPPLHQRAIVPPTHRIVDGDTLDALAERYLGSAGRRMEIFEANRDVLPSPVLLPIGAELKIPERPESTPTPPTGS